MTHRLLQLACLTALTLTGCATSHPLASSEASSPRTRDSFNADWRFTKNDPDAQATADLSYDKLKPYLLPARPGYLVHLDPPEPPQHASYITPTFDDSAWRKLNLPHDYAVEGPFRQDLEGSTGKLDYTGVAWYRKRFTLPPSDSGKQLSLDFDGAMSHATVWVNGHFAGGHPYGYASFRIDLTPFVHPGQDNVVAVRLDNPKDSSRWYPGAGIYRNVWLVTTNPVHVAQYGTYLTTPQITPAAATILLKVDLASARHTPTNLLVQTTLYHADSAGHPTGSPVVQCNAVPLILPPGSTTVTQHATLPHPKLWNLNAPNRYVAVTTLQEQQGGNVLDEYQTPFGVRTLAFSPTDGFSLNGRHVPIQGVCDHHDLGPLGGAFNLRAAQRQFELLKEMGCNALRTSHNPPAPEILDLCDRMGILVMDEAFDCWAIAKRPGDYHLLFPDWHDNDWRAFIRRDRNHPSVIIWSTGNELPEFKKSKPPAGGAASAALSPGQKIAAELTATAHELDPTRPTSFACNSPDAGYNGYQNTVDIFGLNYRPAEYDKFHHAHPDIPLLGSETASTVSTRGEYVFPVENDKAKGLSSNFQVSSYDLSAPPWATNPDDEFAALDRVPSLGEFVWTGFDYLGEPTPFNKDVTNLLNFSDPVERQKMADEMNKLGKIAVPSRSSYFGILDLCGFKKDRFYLYQARWRPDLPMAHILPHWNWPDRLSQVTPVHVYTSGDSAELFLNGKSLGKKTKGQFQYRLRWDDVKYEPGTLKVVAYKAGKKWAQDTVQTTGPATTLTAHADRTTLKADGQDLSFVTITLTDKDGLPVPRSHNPLHFSLDGPAEILAVDNGDPTSHLPFHSTDYPAFNGLALVILRTLPNQHGKITLHVQGDNLKSTEVTLVSQWVAPEFTCGLAEANRK